MSAKISAVISGVSGWVPDEKLTNQQLSTMVDTSDEWITTRTGIKKGGYSKIRKKQLLTCLQWQLKAC